MTSPPDTNFVITFDGGSAPAAGSYNVGTAPGPGLIYVEFTFGSLIYKSTGAGTATVTVNGSQVNCTFTNVNLTESGGQTTDITVSGDVTCP